MRSIALFLVCITATEAAFSAGSSGKRVFVGTPVNKQPKHSVADCMSRNPLTLPQSTTTDEAIALLLNKGLTGAAVVDGTKLVGVVSSFDFLQKEAFEGALLPMEGSLETVEGYVEAAKKICAQKVSDVMTKQPMTVLPECSMREAAALMANKNLHHIPVVGEKGELVGMLSASHVMRDVLNVVKNLPEGKEEDSKEKVSP